MRVFSCVGFLRGSRAKRQRRCSGVRLRAGAHHQHHHHQATTRPIHPSSHVGPGQRHQRRRRRTKYVLSHCQQPKVNKETCSFEGMPTRQIYTSSRMPQFSVQTPAPPTPTPPTPPHANVTCHQVALSWSGGRGDASSNANICAETAVVLCVLRQVIIVNLSGRVVLFVVVILLHNLRIDFVRPPLTG